MFIFMRDRRVAYPVSISRKGLGHVHQ